MQTSNKKNDSKFKKMIRNFYSNIRNINPFKQNDTESPINNLDRFEQNQTFIKNLSRIHDFQKKETIARLWGKWKYEKWKNDLKDNEKESIVTYTNNSQKINELLRKIDTANISDWNESNLSEQKIKSKILDLDSAIRKSSLERNMIVYRRVDLKHFFPDKDINDILEKNSLNISSSVIQRIYDEFIEPNKVYVEKTFVSTSITEDPEDLIKIMEMYDLKRSIILRITVPAGTKAVYVGEISKYKTQNELIIDRQQKFQYMKINHTILRGQEVLVIDMTILSKN